MDRWLIVVGLTLAVVLVVVVISRPAVAETPPSFMTALEQRGYVLTALGDVALRSYAAPGARESIAAAPRAGVGMYGTRYGVQTSDGDRRGEINVYDRRTANVRVDRQAGVVHVNGTPLLLGPIDSQRHLFLNSGLLIFAISEDDALLRTLANITGDSQITLQTQAPTSQKFHSAGLVLERSLVIGIVRGLSLSAGAIDRRRDQ